MSDIWSDEDSDEDKGEMIYVYQSDLRELLLWVTLSDADFSTMNERQAEAWNALDADASS